MRQKSTIYSPEFHNQYGETKEQIRKSKQEKLERKSKDEKQGQSEFRVKKSIKKD